MNSLVSVNPRHMTGLMYVQKFGQLPEGLHKTVCNRRQNKNMELTMQQALERNQPVNWDDFAEQFLMF